MELFHQLHNDSLQMVESIITEQHAQLITNADEVKSAIRSAFGAYMECLRNREAVLLKNVDRAIEAHLARSQTSLGDALSSLRVLRDSVDLLDCDGTGKNVKDQIERLVGDMTLAMEKDMKVTPVVRFEEKGQSALRLVIESCGEVFTETKNVFCVAGKAPNTSSKWSSWLQSPTNLEHMEEPELPYDFDDMGAMMSFSKMAQSPSSQTLLADSAVVASPVFTGEPGNQAEAFGSHFTQLMSTSLEQWLAPSAGVVAKKRLDRVCPGEVGQCPHVVAHLEIENLDQLKCPSPVAKDLQTWLMQPDVVPLPPVADICRSDQPCMSLSQCTSSSDHCINYFFTLSKRTEDWLSPTQEKPDATIVDPSSLSGKSSSCGDEFEVLSWSCTSQTGTHPTARKDSVREELKIWLKATSVPLTDCEWLTDCCMESGCKSNFHSTDAKGIQEWLMKST